MKSIDKFSYWAVETDIVIKSTKWSKRYHDMEFIVRFDVVVSYVYFMNKLALQKRNEL